MAENRGSIGFSTTYRPPVPLEIFSCTRPPTSNEVELVMTDGVNYNYNGQEISLAALKTILKRKELSSEGQEADVDSGRLSGMVFVSERQGLELLHIALHFKDKKPKVFCLADVFGKVNFSGVRMEDSGCIAGDYLVYVTTKDAAPKRQPWTAVYKTNLETGKTDRLTPSGEADLSPSVAPSGKMIAVASFQGKPGGWDGKNEDLQTDIFVMYVEKPFYRCKVVSNGGWPTWGHDNVIFFHRKEGEFWGVFRADVSKVIESLVTLDRIQAATMPDIDATTVKVSPVTPVGIQAMTPAAINATTVAVATIRQKSKFSDVRVDAQYRHIEIFYSKEDQQTEQIDQETVRITQNIMPKADHFNPFVIDCGKRIGYHRCKSGDDISRYSHKLESPHPDVGLFRVPGIFPTFSNDGSKLAFVDNEFKALWLADSKGLRIVYQAKGPDSIFSPVWNKNPKNDIVYVSMGPSFQSDKTLNIYAIANVSDDARELVQLTRASNNAFPSTNLDGTQLVFRSTRDGGDERYKNLYIMEDAKLGESEGREITRLTNGHWIDTHCQWSPTGDWIAFSSTRHKPKGVDVPKSDNDLDPGYFAVFLVNVKYPSTVVRVMASGRDVSGHVNHPFFSPDGKSIVVTADLAAVSVDPISLPLFLHSVRPYGDIFTFDIDPTDIEKNVNVKEFNRITHSRYENSTAAWTRFSTHDSIAAWNKLLNGGESCPNVHPNRGESWHMTGHLCIPKRCC